MNKRRVCDVLEAHYVRSSIPPIPMRNQLEDSSSFTVQAIREISSYKEEPLLSPTQIPKYLRRVTID